MGFAASFGALLLLSGGKRKTVCLSLTVKLWFISRWVCAKGKQQEIENNCEKAILKLKHDINKIAEKTGQPIERVAMIQKRCILWLQKKASIWIVDDVVTKK